MSSKSIIFIIVLLFLLLLSYPTYYIRVQAEQFYCYFDSDNFSLSWRHSVEQQNWVEFYQRQGRQLKLYETWLQTFGAGTPNEGNLVSNVEQGYIGYSEQLLYPELNWIVSPTMQGTININGQKLALYQLLPAYSEVNIQVQHLPIAVYLLGRSCYE